MLSLIPFWRVGPALVLEYYGAYYPIPLLAYLFTPGREYSLWYPFFFGFFWYLLQCYTGIWNYAGHVPVWYPYSLLSLELHPKHVLCTLDNCKMLYCQLQLPVTIASHCFRLNGTHGNLEPMEIWQYVNSLCYGCQYAWRRIALHFLFVRDDFVYYCSLVAAHHLYCRMNVKD
jgi:hypothetical protein